MTQRWSDFKAQWYTGFNSAFLEKMTALKEKLTACTGCGCLSVKECPLRPPNDRAAELGPGARAFDPK